MVWIWMSDTTRVCWDVGRAQSVVILELGASHIRASIRDVMRVCTSRLMMSYACAYLGS
jgi:hypothetical protein